MSTHAFLQNDFFDVIIYQYGYEKCDALHSFGPALRNHYLIHYIISGKGTFRVYINNEVREYVLHAGQAFLIVPNQLIRYIADSEDPWEYMWIEVDGLKARDYLGQAGLSLQAPIYTAKSSESRQVMVDYFQAIVQHSEFSSVKIMGYVYLLFDALIESSIHTRKTASNSNSIQQFYIQSTVSFIEKNYHEEITVENMAEAVGLERSYFSKLFKKLMKKSPQDFLISYRINKSCEILRSSDKTIGEIAALVGYSNQFHFSRAFKKILGDSPREWRKKNQSPGKSI